MRTLAVTIISILGLGASLTACSPNKAEPESSGDGASISDSSITVASLEGRNVVLIVIDSLRADHVGAYGHDSPTTPFIDSLAADGLVFENAASNSSFIAQSLASLFSGRLPSSGGTVGLLEAHPQDETRTLPQFFGKAGYYTGIVSNQPLVKGKGFTKGFEDVQIGTTSDPWSGTKVSERGLEFVEDAADDPFFLYLHYLDPRQPYTVPEELSAKFVKDATADPLDIGEFRRDYADMIDSISGPTDPAVLSLMARYDAEIAYTDSCVRQLVEGLEERGALDNTVIIITSNHGQEFLEHGYIGDTWTVFEESIRIPLIVYAPEALEAARLRSRVSLVDVAPTLLSWLEIPHEAQPFDGETLFAPMGKTFAFFPPQKPQISELIVQQRSIVRSVTQDGWKYIAASRWESPEDRDIIASAFADLTKGILDGSIPAPEFWGATGYEALFNLNEDPGERMNVASENAEVLQKFRDRLEEYRLYCSEHGLAPRELTAVFEALDPSEIEDLESLGYL